MLLCTKDEEDLREKREAEKRIHLATLENIKENPILERY